jgi:ABC-type glycerol-3-phosphate transport system substrate-binding protein
MRKVMFVWSLVLALLFTACSGALEKTEPTKEQEQTEEEGVSAEIEQTEVDKKDAEEARAKAEAELTTAQAAEEEAKALAQKAAEEKLEAEKLLSEAKNAEEKAVAEQLLVEKAAAEKAASDAAKKASTEKVAAEKVAAEKVAAEKVAAEKVIATKKIDRSKKITITQFQWGPRDITKDDAIMAYINGKFNIDFKVERILHREYTKNLELKIAAGDMPDIFRYQLQAIHIYNNLYEDGFLMNFEEYAERYNLKHLKDYINRPGADEYLEKDGSYQLPTYRGKVASLIAVRKDWLDQLKIPTPQTMDEFRLMLKAFKDNNMGGKTTIPLGSSLPGAGLSTLKTKWTGVNEWGKVNGKWMYESVMPAYKDYVKYAARLYQEGLVDMELFTINETQAKSKFVSGVTGVYIAQQDRYLQLEKDILAINNNAKLSILTPQPRGPGGNFTASSQDYFEPIVVIKKGRDEEFLARVAEFIDWTHSPEGIEMLNFGIKNVHYKIVDGVKVKTEIYDRDLIPALGHLTALTTDYSAASAFNEGVLKDHYNYVQKTGVASPVSMITYGSGSDLIPVINKVHDEWFIQFVTGQKNIDQNWEKYLQEMNKAGVEKLTEIINGKRR